MKQNNLKETVQERARTWLSESYDEETRKQVKYMLEEDETELIEAFYKNLEFGTGGLRGIPSEWLHKDCVTTSWHSSANSIR